MKHVRHSTAALLTMISMLLASSNAKAQYVVDPDKEQGSFSGWGVGLTSRGSAHPVLIRAPGYNNGDPSEWSATLFGAASAVHPNYSTAMLTAWAGSLPTPEFGDISTGNDLIPYIDANGYLQMNSLSYSHWYGLTVAVKTNAVGLTGSMIALRKAANPAWDPAANIMSYYAIGSTELNPGLEDHVFIESTAAQLHLNAIVNGDGKIANLDYGVGRISTDPANRSAATFPKRASFYFTLKQSWLSLPAVINSGLTIGSQPMNSSTVYSMTWDPAGYWTTPIIAISHSALFDTLPTNAVEIDAISVDEGELGTASCPRALVFSLTPGSDAAVVNGSAVNGPFDQILVWQRDVNNCNTIITRTKTLSTSLSQPNPMPFSQRLGLRPRGTGIEPDDVISTCGVDPRDGHAPQYMVGFATEELSQGESAMGLSAYRTCPGGTADDVVNFQVTGLNFNVWDMAAIQMFIEGAVYTQNQTPTGSSQVLDPVYITDFDLGQNSIDIPVTLPHAMASAPIPLRVSAWYYGYDASAGVWVPVRQSWVVTIGI